MHCCNNWINPYESIFSSFLFLLFWSPFLHLSESLSIHDQTPLSNVISYVTHTLLWWDRVSVELWWPRPPDFPLGSWVLWLQLQTIMHVEDTLAVAWRGVFYSFTHLCSAGEQTLMEGSGQLSSQCSSPPSWSCCKKFRAAGKILCG